MKKAQSPTRLPYNRNLTITYDNFYRGMPLIPEHRPYILNYLNSLDITIQSALADHARVLAIRFDLHLPLSYSRHASINRSLMSRFIDSFKAMTKSLKHRTEQAGKRFHYTEVHYSWVREIGGRSQNEHFHLVLYLNGQTFRALGDPSITSPGLYGMVSRAWASALLLTLTQAQGLVEYVRNGVYHLKRGAPYPELFKRVSYFAKVKTKEYQDGRHAFGCSRSSQALLQRF